MRNPHNRMVDGIVNHRCAQCRLTQVDCLCALIPRLNTRTRVVVVLHEQEDRKTSNTGRLASRCLPNSEVVIRGGFDRATAVPSWTDVGDPVLLFPHPEARPLEAWRAHPRPVTLIVPDGTWRQAQRVRRRIAGLAAVPCAVVSREAPSDYQLRHTWDPRRLATMEAIAEALGVLEGDAGPQVRETMLRMFHLMVERSMRLRCPAPRARTAHSPAGPACATTALTTSAAADEATRAPPIAAPHEGGSSGDVDLGVENPRQDPGTLVG